MCVYLDADAFQGTAGAGPSSRRSVSVSDAHNVLNSDAVLIFITEGFFQSPHCVRMLLAAYTYKKQIIPLHEIEANRGAVPPR